MRLRRFVVLLCVALALAACARTAQHSEAMNALARSELDVRMYGAPQIDRALPRYAAYLPVARAVAVPRAAIVEPVAVSLPDGPYTLDSGDKLRIVVFGQDALSNNYTVDAQGAVNLPLIGAVEARGRTTLQLGSAIAARLRQGYIREPNVAVEIETYRPFFVLGEVTFPGQYPYVPNMTAENAIAIAGGFTPRAFRDTVTITRKLQGVPIRTKLPLRYPLRPGDTIEVSERWF
jgi:polysaccharide export outer membrane protein